MIQDDANARESIIPDCIWMKKNYSSFMIVNGLSTRLFLVSMLFRSYLNISTKIKYEVGEITAITCIVQFIPECTTIFIECTGEIE